MRTADRARRDGMSWPGKPIQRRPWEKVNEGVASHLHRTPIIVADDVHAWRLDRIRNGPDRGYGFEDFNDLRLPWESVWIEYPSTSGDERRAILISEETGYVLEQALAKLEGRPPSPPRDQRDRDEAKEKAADWYVDAVIEAMKDAKLNGCQVVRHILTSFIYIDDHKRVLGPVGLWLYCLDELGRVYGTRWLFLGGDAMAAGLRSEGLEPEEWLLATSDAGLATIDLLNMRNVTTETIVPRTVRRHRKRGNLPPLRYHVLRLKLPGGRTTGLDGREPGRGFDAGIPYGIHVVRGHPAHYGDCCPGRHEPNKPLFGKWTGVYWVPAHLRGSESEGQVMTDFEATVEEIPDQH